MKMTGKIPCSTDPCPQRFKKQERVFLPKYCINLLYAAYMKIFYLKERNNQIAIM